MTKTTFLFENRSDSSFEGTEGTAVAQIAQCSLVHVKFMKYTGYWWGKEIPGGFFQAKEHINTFPLPSPPPSFQSCSVHSLSSFSFFQHGTIEHSHPPRNRRGRTPPRLTHDRRIFHRGRRISPNLGRSRRRSTHRRSGERALLSSSKRDSSDVQGYRWRENGGICNVEFAKAGCP